MSSGNLKRVSSADKEISPPPSKRRVATTTTGSAVANFFKPASQKEPEKITFKTLHETLLIARYSPNPNDAKDKPKAPVKIAAFDLDDTLIATKSGLKFARGPDDWKWWNASVPGKLKQFHADGFTLVVLSNQGAVKLRPDPKAPAGSMKSLTNFKGRVSAVLGALDLPVTLYAGTEKDMYRKPRTGMWTQLVEDLGVDVGDVEREHCVFVGDAAGREGDKAAGSKKDHSCSDRNFATNVGIPFQTPEEYFLNEAAKPFTQVFDPETYFAGIDGSSQQASETAVIFSKKHDVELVLFCGSPGAGKSTFYWQRMEPLGYARVNQDILKTREKCMKTAVQLLESGQSVAVDNTNADVETRAAWIALANKQTKKVPVRLVHFTAAAKLCEHNDTVRALAGDTMNPEKRILLPKMAFTGFAGRYREPKAEEGFEDITRVDFMFTGTDEQKALWKKHWIS